MQHQYLRSPITEWPDVEQLGNLLRMRQLNLRGVHEFKFSLRRGIFKYINKYVGCFMKCFVVFSWLVIAIVYSVDNKNNKCVVCKKCCKE